MQIDQVTADSNIHLAVITSFRFVLDSNLQLGSVVRIKDACGNYLILSNFPPLHVRNTLRTSMERSSDRQSFV